MKENIKLEDRYWGMTINKVMGIAQQTATEDQNCEFEFNGRKVIVSKTTDLTLLERDYSNSFVMEWDTIGADCVKEYSPETLKLLDEKTKAQEERERKRQEEYERKDKEQRESFESKVVGIEMSLKDQEAWDKIVAVNVDPYSKCAVDYARDWAKLMQSELSKGSKLEDIAGSTSFALGFHGITGFMYGAAVQMLSQCWEHGEALRVWHNKEYEHEGEGVVNPAVMTINCN